MKIVLAASELAPYAGTGEFAMAMRELADGLCPRGHDVSVILPYYRAVRENPGGKIKRSPVKFSVPVGSARYPCAIRELRPANGPQIFFIEREEFFDRSGLYGTAEGDYQDNAARFIFFSKCVVELVRRMDPSPDVLHVHNWQAALVPVLAADQRLGIPTVLTAHSLEYQGNFWSYDFGLTNLPADYFSTRGLEFYGSLNLLKGGILYSQRVVLPGARFAGAAQTPAFGCGLDAVLREQAGKLEGIANGLDVAAWNPATDREIAKRYKDAAGKAANQKAWLARAGFTSGKLHLLTIAETPADDGMEILLPALDRLREADCRVAVLGKVSPRSLAAMEFARRRHAGQFAWLPDFDESLLRTALAGSDALLNPAPVPPMAMRLKQALRYGLLPIHPAESGMQQLAPALQQSGERGFGFPFFVPTSDGLIDAVRHALHVRREGQWEAAVNRAMAVDFSWEATASAVEALYASLKGRTDFARAA